MRGNKKPHRYSHVCKIVRNKHSTCSHVHSLFSNVVLASDTFGNQTERNVRAEAKIWINMDKLNSLISRI